MRKKSANRVIAVLLFLVLCLTGCKTGGTSSTEKDKDAESGTESIEDSTGKDSTEKDTDAEENTEDLDAEAIDKVTEEALKHTLVGTSPVYDRSLTEGDMAVYYMASSSIYRYCGSTIGNGDSTLIIAPDGTTMLIDTQGPACTPAVVATLQALGIDSLDYMVFSHEHEDHIGGYSTLLRYITVKQVYMNDYDYANSYLHNGLMAELEASNVPVTYLYEGDSFSFGGIDVKVYNPTKDYVHAGSGSTVNSGSLVFKMTYKDSTFLFGGDIEEDQEIRLIEKYGSELQADVCKISHHGHDTSSSKAWTQNVSAKLAVVEGTQIFSNTVLGRYMLSGATVLATCLNDTIAIWTSGDGTYNVQVETEQYSDYTELPDDVKDGYFVIK